MYISCGLSEHPLQLILPWFYAKVGVGSYQLWLKVLDRCHHACVDDNKAV